MGTAEAVSRLSDYLKKRGMRDKVVMLWNANNTYGFDLVDWSHLNDSATITTVSRYMKHIMWGMGLNPLVIPNGIPASLLRSVDDEVVNKLRSAFGAGLILFKMARWHPDKRWNVAVEAVAELKRAGLRPLLIARGGLEPYGREVMDGARSMGLTVREANTSSPSLEDSIAAIREAPGRRDRRQIPCPQASRLLYRASDGVWPTADMNRSASWVSKPWRQAVSLHGTGEIMRFLRELLRLETDDPAEISSAPQRSETRPMKRRECAGREAHCSTVHGTLPYRTCWATTTRPGPGMLNGTTGLGPPTLSRIKVRPGWVPIPAADEGSRRQSVGVLHGGKQRLLTVRAAEPSPVAGQTGFLQRRWLVSMRAGALIH
jgi:hypothetical protein